MAIYAQVTKAAEEANQVFENDTKTQLGYKYQKLKRSIDNSKRFRVLLNSALTPPDGGDVNDHTGYLTAENLHARLLIIQAKFDVYGKVSNLI